MTENTPVVVESGAAFPDDTDAEVFVEATFLESGNQLQQVFVGLEPVLLVQPEYDADAHEVKFLVTAVDLNPAGLVEVLELLLDSAKTMVEQENADEDFELAQLPETPEG